MKDLPAGAVEVSEDTARRLRAMGMIPGDAALVDREEVDWWGSTYARTGSGLFVPEGDHPLERTLLEETRDQRGEEWGDEEFLEWLRGQRPHPQRTGRDPLLGCDLFAGAGGFSLGMHMAGIDVVAAIDNAPAAAHTYLLNLARPDVELRFTDEAAEVDWERRGAPEKPLEEWAGSAYQQRGEMDGGCRGFIFGDIRKVSGEDLLEASGVEKIDVVFGGPPCQGLSTSNAQRCLEDPRNGMLWEFMRLVRELEPRAFMIENVPPLLTVADGALFEAIAEIATAEGYYVRANVVDASNYGVPQYRRRALVIGTTAEAGPYQFPMPTNWPAGRNPEGADVEDWTSHKLHAGDAPHRTRHEDRPRVEVDYDPETGSWAFTTDEREDEEPDPQAELF